MNRRSFLRGAGLILAAPAIVKVASIMPVRAAPVFQFSGFETRIPTWMIMNQKDWAELYSDRKAFLRVVRNVSLDPMLPRGHLIMGCDAVYAP